MTEYSLYLQAETINSKVGFHKVIAAEWFTTGQYQTFYNWNGLIPLASTHVHDHSPIDGPHHSSSMLFFTFDNVFLFSFFVILF